MKLEHFHIAKKLERKKGFTIQLQKILEGQIALFKGANSSAPEVEGIANCFMDLIAKTGVAIQNDCEKDFNDL